MKQLIAVIILLAVFALAAFAYRYGVERPMGTRPDTASSTVATTTTQACTTEAKICPDGSAVGRTGPNCSFATCPAPNVEISTGSTTLAFVLPAGYTQLEKGAPGQTTLRIYQKSTGVKDQYHTLTVSAFPIGAGQTASSIMLANTTFDPSGMQATSTSQFKQKTIGSHTFYVIDIGRFEGQVETAYYLPLNNVVLRFDLIERSVTNWTDPNLNTSALPQHQAVVKMLATLQAS